MTARKISAILLAAGLSRRMGCDKLLLPFHGKTLLAHAVDLLEALPVDEKIIVTTKPRLAHILLPPGIVTVINPHPETGQSDSVRLGVSAAAQNPYLFLSADQPRLDRDILLPLLDISAQNPDKIVYPHINGKPCMPSLFPARFRTELLQLSGDTGGRVVRMAHPESCLAVDAQSPEAFADIDTEADYRALTSVNMKQRGVNR